MAEACLGRSASFSDLSLCRSNSRSTSQRFSRQTLEGRGSSSPRPSRRATCFSSSAGAGRSPWRTRHSGQTASSQYKKRPARECCSWVTSGCCLSHFSPKKVKQQRRKKSEKRLSSSSFVNERRCQLIWKIVPHRRHFVELASRSSS